MRTIKFRGKRVDNGEWVYGDLVHYATSKNNIQYDHVGISNDFEHDEVDPSTVGQFTGLTDKDGKEIYEGDFVRFTIGDESTDCFVEYKRGGFMVESDSFFGAEEYDITTIGFAADEMDETVVSGNIHDDYESEPSDKGGEQ